MTDNGNYLFWITEPESEPDAWRIAINEARGHDWYIFDGTLTDLLTALLSGELHVPLFPADVLHRGATFTPSRQDNTVQPAPPAGWSVDTNTIREWARANGYEVPPTRTPVSTIDDLTRLGPPPAAPPAVDWTAAEGGLGRTLPRDYKELAAAYGPGSFCNFLHVYHPSGSLAGPLASSVQEQLQRDCDQGTFPVPHDPRHLLVAGVTDNGNYLFWITEPESDPDHWRIAINGTLTDLLTAFLSGELHIPRSSAADGRRRSVRSFAARPPPPPRAGP